MHQCKLQRAKTAGYDKDTTVEPADRMSLSHELVVASDVLVRNRDMQCIIVILEYESPSWSYRSWIVMKCNLLRRGGSET
jgi:hypothetical protein